jgi:hypothetical protein
MWCRENRHANKSIAERYRQVGALWKVLSHQAIGVLVRPALPRALRIAKIYIDFGRQRKATMRRLRLVAATHCEPLSADEIDGIPN